MRNLLDTIWKTIGSFWQLLKKPLSLLSVFSRITWLLFPAIFFLFATWACFWNLSQGRDVLLGMLEKKWVAGIVLLAILFWVMVSWYSSRILIYRKRIVYEDSPRLAFHMPRLMGYLGFSIVWIALLRLPKDAYLGVHIPKGYDWGLFLVSIVLYFLLDKLFATFRDKKLKMSPDENADTWDALKSKERLEKKKFTTIYILMGCLVAILLALNTLTKNAWLFFISVIILQLVFLFIVIIRRGRVPFKSVSTHAFEMPLDFGTIEAWQQSENEKGNPFSIGVWERILYNANIPRQEKWFFIAFNIISALSLIVYFITINSYSFSVRLGSFATVLIAFGVLVGFLSLVTFASVVSRVNFHIIIWIVIWTFGNFFEPHWVKLIQSPGVDTKIFDNRPGLNNYFDDWVEKRKVDIDKDSSYPVFFVLADGGASRSGYWTASVLSKLEDTTNGKFSQHLFCLSGASGGSVGNGTFLALLKNRDSLQKMGQTFTRGATDFLHSDFLTYTIARMLGPDFVRPVFPLPFIDDRAAALEHAIDKGENSFLQQRFETPVSSLIPFTNGNDNLPMICINTTRMQDGRPSVLSTIKIDYAAFGERIDILETLKAGKDIKLSTAVVLGARFPYVSPAGRIDSSYYVDGGYFDNSGAGVVNEMLIALRQYIKDSLLKKPYLAKLKFYVIHAQNGWSGGGNIKKVNPIVNDLASPVLTLVGAYGTQTSVNDWRLIKYINAFYDNRTDSGYHPVNLYSGKPKEDEYPMNWVISNYYINKMDSQLKNPDMKNLINWLHTKISW